MSRSGAGRGEPARHTREATAYILLVADGPRGWGGLWGRWRLLGSAGGELGCVTSVTVVGELTPDSQHCGVASTPWDLPHVPGGGMDRFPPAPPCSCWLRVWLW